MARDETRPLDAAAAWHAARAGKAGSRILGWKLDRAERAGLIERFPPTYDHVVADHVTLAARMGAGAQLPEETVARIVGRADDGDGVEAMVVEIAGTTDRGARRQKGRMSARVACQLPLGSWPHSLTRSGLPDAVPNAVLIEYRP